ncbi:hypothetical protein PIB30_085255 [Stylosanthes scabra]|uniref:Uncharacterized protein n=1 Tax=Stylosanthes scabra TaxID=79078 RepID=A0ABU6YT37_9FABA|nr:hypothetical protein [Stylosanthes scabra]
MMCHMGADGDPFVAAVPVGELFGGTMALAQSGRTDHRVAAGGMKAVMHSDNTVVGATYDWAWGEGNCTAAVVMAEGFLERNHEVTEEEEVKQSKVAWTEPQSNSGSKLGHVWTRLAQAPKCDPIKDVPRLPTLILSHV